jgi:peptide/nickel transport system ATP-binding protein
MAAVPIPDPARRDIMRSVSNDEIASPTREPDFVVPMKQYNEVSAEHLVQV